MLPFLNLFADLFSKIYLLIAYIGKNNSFPKPLSSEDEKMYFKRLKEGDQEAKNILIEKNLRLVAHVSRKYQTSKKDQEDLISIGTIGLIKAINTFDAEKNTRLVTYAAKCIDNEILMVLRSNKKLNNEVSLQETIGTDSEGNEISLIDILKSESEAVFDEVEQRILIKKLLKNMETVLSERERIILELRYGLKNGKSKTQKEIAKIFHISRSYVYGVRYCKSRLDNLETTGFAGFKVFGDRKSLNVS